jgi:Zn ribbon nucleic-acid-binding protein
MQEEIVIEVKNCKQCNSEFEVTNNDLVFYSKISPCFGDRKFEIPSPKICPDCRQQRRLAFINERKLYKRESTKTGKNIISVYSPDKDLNVIEQEQWWGNFYD